MITQRGSARVISAALLRVMVAVAAIVDPASAIFSTSDGGGYWIVTALGSVAAFGNAPNDGAMSGTHLNGPIIAASGS